MSAFFDRTIFYSCAFIHKWLQTRLPAVALQLAPPQMVTNCVTPSNFSGLPRLIERILFLDHISWDNFNESGDLKAQVEAFKNYTGYYPESVHVDKIYRTRENRAWCKERGIIMSGPPLGRPPANVSKEKKKQDLESERIRNCIEGKFGQGKRRFSLNRVMTKLAHTSETAIAITFLVMNLSTQLSRLFYAFLCLFFKTTPFSPFTIIENNQSLNHR